MSQEPTQMPKLANRPGTIAIYTKVEIPRLSLVKAVSVNFSKMVGQ